MAATISCSSEERNAVLTAIGVLNGNPVVKHMSYAMIANAAGLPESKARIVVDELLSEGRLVRVTVNSGRVPRYYYVVNIA